MKWRAIVRKAAKLASRVGLGPGLKLTPEKFGDKAHLLAKLHLGCGNIHIPGWCNVDSLATGAADLISDVRTLPGIPDECADIVYSCHLLEHFSHAEVPPILRRWREVLKPGGELRISVPDLDAITRIYQANLSHFQVPGHEPWIALLYGGQKDAYDFHKTGFNFCWLGELLRRAGFAEIERYPHEPHFIPGVVDNSMATAPFGEYISVNVRATKPH